MYLVLKFHLMVLQTHLFLKNAGVCEDNANKVDRAKSK